ncbi:MAG: protein kinase, partial [Myxococcaceae bacterium]
MRFIIFLFSLNLCAGSADFLFHPRIPDVFQTLKKNFHKVLSWGPKEKVKPNLEENEVLKPPPKKKLVTRQEEDFLKLLFKNRFSGTEEYLAEMERLEALLESRKPLTPRELFFLEIISELELSPNSNFKQVRSVRCDVPVLSFPAANALIMSVVDVATRQRTLLTPELLDSLNESESLTNLLSDSQRPLVCMTPGSNFKDPFCLQMYSRSSAQEPWGKIVKNCKYPPIVIWGSIILLNRYLSKNESYELFPKNTRYITAISLLVAAKLLEKGRLSVNQFCYMSGIGTTQINRLIENFLRGIELDLHLSPTGMRQLFRAALKGEEGKNDVLKILREHRPNRLTSIWSPRSLSASLFKPLGKGTYGEVWVSGNEVMKVFVKCDQNEGELAASDVFSEILHGGIFQHPNLMQTTQIYLSEAQCVWGALMPLCSGGDLYHHFKNTKKSLELGKIKKYANQLLSALKYMHEHEFAHNDVKTSNIFIDGEDIRLGDYGLSRVNEPAVPAEDWVIQTLNYRSPEALLGILNAEAQADIWAAGCVLGEMALSELLFQGVEEKDILQRIREFLDCLQKPDIQPHWISKHSELLAKLGEDGYNLL